MKVLKLLALFLILGLASQVKARNITDYQSYILENNFNSHRKYDYSCHTITHYENGAGEVFAGHSSREATMEQTISENGLKFAQKSEFSYFNGDSEVIVTTYATANLNFLDKDTLEKKSVVNTIKLEAGEFIQKTSERISISKLVNGLEKTVSLIVDGEEQKLTSESIKVTHDPFFTSYTVSGFDNTPNPVTGLLNYRTVCHYNQQGLKNYKEYIPTVLVGVWKQTGVHSIGDIAKMKFSKEGQLTLFDQSLRVSETQYELKKDILEFKGELYKLQFESVGSFKMRGITSGLSYEFKRQSAIPLD